MKRYAFLLFVTLSSCLAVFIAVAYADGTNSRRFGLLHSFVQHKIDEAVDALALTGEQEESIKGHIRAARVEIHPRVASLHNERMKIRELIQNERIPEEEVLAQFTVLQETQQELLLERVRLVRAIRHELNDEQKELLQTRILAVEKTVKGGIATLNKVFDEWLLEQ